jgi:hypothetical protein
MGNAYVSLPNAIRLIDRGNSEIHRLESTRRLAVAPLCRIHSVMMVLSAQLDESRGARPPPFTIFTSSPRVTPPPPQQN